MYQTLTGFLYLYTNVFIIRIDRSSLQIYYKLYVLNFTSHGYENRTVRSSVTTSFSTDSFSKIEHSEFFEILEITLRSKCSKRGKFVKVRETSSGC